MNQNASEFRPQTQSILETFGAKQREAEVFLSTDVNVVNLYDAVQTIGMLRQFKTFESIGNTRVGLVEEITLNMENILPPKDQRELYNLVMLRLRGRLQDAVQQSQDNLNARIDAKVITGDEAVRETGDAKAAVAAVEKYLASLVN